MPGNVTRGLMIGSVLGSATMAFAQSATVQPGQWEMISVTKSVEMPNAPPQVAKMMAGRTTTVRRCITPREAADGGREMMKAKPSCTFGRYIMAGGKIDAEMTCSQAGGTMTAVTTGTYTPTTMSSMTRMSIKGPAPMTITTSMSGKRVGGC